MPYPPKTLAVGAGALLAVAALALVLWPRAPEKSPAVAAPGGFAGEGGVWAAVAPVVGGLAGFGPLLQAARTTAASKRFIRSPG
jgi:hypothetical protein